MENTEEIDEELGELDDMPELFHISSLRERADPPLEIYSAEVYEARRWYDSNNNEMINAYQICQQLGQGAFGKVYKVRKDGHYFALKVCSIIGLQKQRFFAADGDFANSLDVLYNQLNIIKRIQHKNIAKCYEIIYGSDRIYTINQLGSLGQIMIWKQLQMKYVRNKKVVQYISDKYKTTNLGDITRIVFLQICEGIKYLHDHDITNRDIKVDNILCSETTNFGDQVKVIDFTTVRYKQNDDISYFPTGTPGFRGPEHQFAASDGYSCKASDIWSVGYSMYVFYHENMPFYGEDDLDMDIKAKNIPLVFDEQCPSVLVEVIQKMTRKDWRERITINQTLQILRKS